MTIALQALALVQEKRGAGPSSLLHTTLEGPTEYANARWMSWISTWRQMDHVSWSLGPFSRITSWSTNVTHCSDRILRVSKYDSWMFEKLRKEI